MRKATVDELGIFGLTVRVPSPAVWRIVKAAVMAGAGTVAGLRTALGGGTAHASDVADFWLECWLAVAMERGATAPGRSVRVLHGNTWRDAVVTSCVRDGMVVATLAGTTAACRLDIMDWWYVAAAASSPEGGGEPRRPLSLTFPTPGVAAVAAAATVHGMARASPDGRMHAAAALVARMAVGGGVGAAFARRTMLAVHALQTADELRENRTMHRNAVGWSRAHAERAAELVALIESGRLMNAGEARACRDMAREYVQQLLDGPHMAAVWGGVDGDGQSVDAWDDEEEEGGGEDAYDRDDDLIASSDDEVEDGGDDEEPGDGDDADMSDDEEESHTAVCWRRPAGRLLNPKVAAWVRELESIHDRRFDRIYADVRAAFQTATAQDIHTVLSLSGRRAAAKGERVMVPFTTVRFRYVKPMKLERRVGFAPPAPPDSCGGLGNRDYVPN